MLSFLRTVLAVLVALVIFVGLLFGATFALIPGPKAPERLPDEIVLFVDLRLPLVDQPVYDPFSLGGEATVSIIDLTRTLEKAETDDRVKGLYFRTGGAPISMAQSQELREAFQSFKDKGKFIVAHAQSFAAPGLGTYSTATLADDIWLQPGSFFSASGAAIQGVFLKGLLDKVGVEPQIEEFHEYKGFASMFVEDGFPLPQRENLHTLRTSSYRTAIDEIAQARMLSPNDVISKLGTAPISTEMAVSAGLIDKAGYDDDAEASALERAGLFSDIVYWRDYKAVAGATYAKGTGVALIFGDGEIHEGNSRVTGLTGATSTIGGDTYANAIRLAADDPAVKAILFRVNSPGGSVIASDQIWDAVNYAQDEQEKPVIISMGNAAASGGYYVSMSARRIIALPSTVTGSIGVVTGKMSVGGVLEKAGVTTDEIVVGGDNILMYSNLTPFTDEQRATLRENGESIYEDFIAKVGKGRDLSPEEVDKVARGRVWTGKDALDRGLVDQLGGFRTAVAAVREELNLEPGAPLKMIRYPEARTPFERFAEALGVSAEAMHTVATAAAYLDMPGVKEAREALATDRRGPAFSSQPITVY